MRLAASPPLLIQDLSVVSLLLLSDHFHLLVLVALKLRLLKLDLLHLLFLLVVKAAG
jgi:hypothetical protein